MAVGHQKARGDETEKKLFGDNVIPVQINYVLYPILGKPDIGCNV